MILVGNSSLALGSVLGPLFNPFTKMLLMVLTPVNGNKQGGFNCISPANQCADSEAQKAILLFHWLLDKNVNNNFSSKCRLYL